MGTRKDGISATQEGSGVRGDVGGTRESPGSGTLLKAPRFSCTLQQEGSKRCYFDRTVVALPMEMNQNVTVTIRW
jgi:hypothetical protein